MCQCIAILSRMTEMQRESLIRKHVPEEVHIRLSVENTLTSKPKLPEILGETREMSECQQFQHTVAVGLVALPVYSKEDQVNRTLNWIPHICHVNYLALVKNIGF